MGEYKNIRFKDIILYEDDNYIVINKPGYISSLHDRNPKHKSIIEMAKEYAEDAILCHRLDKETSGVLLIAKNENAHRNAAIQFENREVDKEYHALCDGYLDFHDVEIDLPIYSGSGDKVRIDSNRGKESKTIFNTITIYKNFSLLSCKPITGRMHQIRIHLASQNAVITGDVLYGGVLPLLSKLKRKYNKGKYEEFENPIFKRIALHSRLLRLKNVDGTTLEVTAEYPKDFKVLLKILDKYDQRT